MEGAEKMAETVVLRENKPFPNNSLPVIYYPGALKSLTEASNRGEKVKAYLEKNGYSNGWINGILSHHHFHSNTHEVLVCLSGTATVQLGGPGAGMYSFEKGDLLLLPAGTAHKCIKATEDFQIVGAYPGGKRPDMQNGNIQKYEELKTRISQVSKPKYGPLEKNSGAIFDYWK